MANINYKLTKAIGDLGETIAKTWLEGRDYNELGKYSGIKDRIDGQKWESTSGNANRNRNRDFVVNGKGTRNGKQDEKHEVKTDLRCLGGKVDEYGEPINKNTNNITIELEVSNIENIEEVKQKVESISGFHSENKADNNKAWFLGNDYADFYHYVLPFNAYFLNENGNLSRAMDSRITASKEIVRKFKNDETIDKTAGLVKSFPPHVIMTITGDKLKELLENKLGVIFTKTAERKQNNTINIYIPLSLLLDEYYNNIQNKDISISFAWDVATKTNWKALTPTQRTNIYIPLELAEKSIKVAPYNKPIMVLTPKEGRLYLILYTNGFWILTNTDIFDGYGERIKGAEWSWLIRDFIDFKQYI